MFPFRGLAIILILGVGFSIIYLGSDIIEPRASLTQEISLSAPNPMNTSINVQQLYSLLAAKDDITVIDVRTPEEVVDISLGFDGILNIPVDQLQQRVSEVPTDRPIYVFCRSGNRSSMAQMLLKSQGIDSTNVEGGMIDWNAAEYPTR